MGRTDHLLHPAGFPQRSSVDSFSPPRVYKRRWDRTLTKRLCPFCGGGVQQFNPELLANRSCLKNSYRSPIVFSFSPRPGLLNAALFFRLQLSRQVFPVIFQKFAHPVPASTCRPRDQCIRSDGCRLGCASNGTCIAPTYWVALAIVTRSPSWHTRPQKTTRLLF